ncbi:DUF3168 domain-containing protein [Pararhizobium sp. O133]|uniref:DUF3168 domain-containing protein n=1 Tax=Pararhizobium sp. O133 TaxID=3449278 RepID=UPI003F689555
MSAAEVLQKAIFLALSNDAALTGLIGGDGVRDHLQARMERPVVFIASIESRDASTASEPGEEHLMTLEVRTGEGGNLAVQAIAARVRALLDDADLDLDGFVLVNLFHRRTRTRREARAKGHVAEMRFRAVTE